MPSSPNFNAHDQGLSQSDSCGSLISPSDRSYISPNSESDTLHTPLLFDHHQPPLFEYSPTLAGFKSDPQDNRSLCDTSPFPTLPLYRALNPSSTISSGPDSCDLCPSTYSSPPPPTPTISPAPPYPFYMTHGSTDDGLSSPQMDSDLNLDAYLHCPRFPRNHALNRYFVEKYQLKDELGSGGYGFVMTATNREEGHEVAVKFIVKSKVPDHAWMEDEAIGKLPSEVMLLCFIEHPNIVKCLDLFDDSLYFYMVQELHGSPWHQGDQSAPKQIIQASRSLSSMPSLSSSLSTASEDSIRSVTPPPRTPSTETSDLSGPSATPYNPTIPSTSTKNSAASEPHALLKPARPSMRYSRRPSHDLFECIEQSEHKRLPEGQARYVFSQVVDAVHYLDSQGVAHRDIKDENLVIDNKLRVKLIDFGSAIIVDPSEPKPFYSLFYGTAAYASSEILKKKPYQAAPAEVWTLGVLLSYLLTGSSPFPTVKDAMDGRLVIHESGSLKLTKPCLHLLRRCLDPNPLARATIGEVKNHKWLLSA